jgi:hypothetical protein
VEPAAPAAAASAMVAPASVADVAEVEAATAAARAGAAAPTAAASWSAPGDMARNQLEAFVGFVTQIRKISFRSGAVDDEVLNGVVLDFMAMA